MNETEYKLIKDVDIRRMPDKVFEDMINTILKAKVEVD